MADDVEERLQPLISDVPLAELGEDVHTRQQGLSRSREWIGVSEVRSTDTPEEVKWLSLVPRVMSTMQDEANVSSNNTVQHCDSFKKLDGVQEAVDEVREANFEKAISLCGLGKFNYMLVLVSIPATWCAALDTSNASYLLPAAECDLQMNSFDKGLLNSAIYIGMMSSAYMWGFLADTTGRHRLLVIGYALDAICNLLASLSQSFWFLLVLKGLGGFIVFGPMVIFSSYLSEFHSDSNRARVLMCQGLFSALGQVATPVLAWFVLPQQWDWSATVFGMVVHFNSWRLFLVICMIPGLLASILLWRFFDETPKFLMASGRFEEALVVFRRIYTMNTGLSPDTYPVTVLVNDVSEGDGILTYKSTSKNSFELLKIGLKQAKPLFTFPLLPWALLVYSLMFGALLGKNTLRLWMPQLFATMEEFSLHHSSMNATGESVSLCEMLSYNKTNLNNNLTMINSSSMQCGEAMENSSVYINSILVSLVCAVGFTGAGFIIKIVGNKNMLLLAFCVGGVSSIALFWSRSVAVTLMLSSVYITACSLCWASVMTVAVELFPTSLRTMTTSLAMMVGQVGSTTGNMLFPVLLDINCILSFFLLGGVVLVCAGLTLFLPGRKKTEPKKLIS